MSLKGSKTEQHLKDAFTTEAQAIDGSMSASVPEARTAKP